ncbi:alpha/beta fold hydrolase [Vibrio mangrovi]|uniref:Alpha/beta fold hydrolase n=1 Tax=Vibrio mangrovi TaxID=474394 RepID=A0A1Y6IYH8_9VIBR|nr:alpha/beta fold hydrolase [Vibrio mangrovi]MDW6002589.1 alpha/beta fold hydrolase [Vibrio mangrovi]SMS01880.1 Phospholipase YtpA [Vibrio mangrovi]
MNQHSIPTYPYTQESLFEQAINNDISCFWENRQEGTIPAFDRKQLYWCRFTHPDHNQMIFIANGRIESTWKYQELLYDLFRQGYDIYTYDHRGQGFSARLCDDEQIGHVGEFDDYIRDMETLLEHIETKTYQARFLLAHSMGGAVVTRYIQTHPRHGFHAMALTAPMFGLNIPRLLRPIALPLTQILSGLSAKPTYAPGYQAYYPKPFEDNPLTHSQIRYQWFRALYEEHPELKIGGPSTHWVWQSLIAIRQCHQLTRQITLPTLILQAGEDTIVNNHAQDLFCRKVAKTNPQIDLVNIAGAKHELLFETDQYRTPTLDEILKHFSSCSPDVSAVSAY